MRSGLAAALGAGWAAARRRCRCREAAVGAGVAVSERPGRCRAAAAASGAAQPRVGFPAPRRDSACAPGV